VSISDFKPGNITMIRTAIVAASLALLTSTSFAQYYSYGGYRPSYGYSSYSYQPSYGYGYTRYGYGYSRYGYGRRW
jgi:hypothetical protein